MKKGKEEGLAFLIPFGILMLALFCVQIYPFSDKTILAGDGYHQYSVFHLELGRLLKKGILPFYSFKTGGGTNFYALMSYYTGSVFAPLFIFATTKTLASFVYWITLAKFGLTGLTSFLFIKHVYKDVPKPLQFGLSTSYALMNFGVSQLFLENWQDVVMMLPLIMWGFKRLLVDKKPGLYTFALAGFYIQNYYFSYIVSLFIALTMCGFLIVDFKRYVKRVLPAIGYSIISLMLGSVMLLPALIDLRTHGEAFNGVRSLLTIDFNPLDLMAKQFVGAYDTLKYQSIPIWYIGLIPFLFLIVFLVSKQFTVKRRLGYFFVFLILVLSLFIQPLDSLWQGFHAPNMFLHRYSFLISFVLLCITCEIMQQLKTIERRAWLSGLIIVLVLFVAVSSKMSNYPFLNLSNLVWTFGLLIFYGFLWYLWKIKNELPHFLVIMLSLGMLIEVEVNSFYQLQAIGVEWKFVNRGTSQSYDNFMVKQFPSGSFERSVIDDRSTVNDGMRYNLNTISQFSSVRNRKAGQLLNQLGFYSQGTNLSIHATNNTLLGYGLVGVNQKIRYQQIERLPSSLDVATVVPNYYQDVAFTRSAFDNQTRYANALSHLDQHYYENISVTVDNIQAYNSEIIPYTLFDSGIKQLNLKLGTRYQQTFHFIATKGKRYYLALDKRSFGRFDQLNPAIVSYTINGKVYARNIRLSMGVIDLGEFSENESVMIRINYPFAYYNRQPGVNVRALDLDAYNRFVKTTQKNPTPSKEKNNGLITQYKADRASDLVYSIPYDKGWSARVNGQLTPILSVQDGFMKVAIPKGKGTVELTFVPQGFKLGLMLSLIGFVTYSFVSHRKK